MKHLKDLDTAELLEAEAHATAQVAKCDYGSNIYRKWDKQLDRILAEMMRRSEPAKSEPPPPFDGALGLACALLLCAFSWSLSGCEPAQEAPTAAPVTCEIVGRGELDLVLRFSDPDIRAPGGLDCVSLGGGEFDCKPDFCLLVTYPGTCPACVGEVGE